MSSDFIKTIHQIWFEFEKSKMPDITTYTMLKTQLMDKNPEYEYKLWKLEDAKILIDTHYPQFSIFFDSKMAFDIVKCDFFRYLLMYHFGGIYIDLDFACIKSFNDLFKNLSEHNLETIVDSNKTHGIILTEEWYDSINFTKTFHNGFLISKNKENPFWLKLLFDINNSVKKIKVKQDVFEYSGTRKLCNHFKLLKEMCDCVTVLPYYYVCPYKCVDKKNIMNVEYANDKKQTIPSLETHSWCFFNYKEYTEGEVHRICNESYMACIYLPSGSTWT